jgi:RNA 2',3'-cyclic 3'-phosphodiesterase
MRLFIAVDLSEDARQAIAVAQNRIAAALAAEESRLKRVRPEHMHLTLVFLGRVADDDVPALVDAIGRDADATPFEVVFAGLGVFPPRGAPRVLWLGVADGAAALVALQRDLAQRTIARGIALEARPFHPHLTLGRWRSSRPLDRGRALAAGVPGPVASVRVERATLYESRLSPAGPTYTPLAHANLTG